MEKIIAKKMKEGVTFYILPKKPSTSSKPQLKKLKSPEDARKHRALSIPDEDFSNFVMNGHGEAIMVPGPEVIENTRKAETPAEAAPHFRSRTAYRSSGNAYPSASVACAAASRQTPYFQ